MSTAITSLTARIPSPSSTRDETRPPSIAQDKAGRLGYNRELIGAAQALRFDSALADRARKWRAIAGDGNSTKEVRWNVEK
jgi:hypothetical protein